MKNISLYLLMAVMATSCVPLRSSGNVPQANANTQIHDIQGCSHISPLNRQTVVGIPGIVTWKVNNGFYMQGESQDDKNCSSEGIFIHTDNYPTVLPGDKVEVTGKVNEFTPGNQQDNNLSVTEIDMRSIKVISTENNLPAPFFISNAGEYPVPDTVIEDDALQTFDPAIDGIDFWESLEGMRVEVDNAAVVGPRNSYGEVFVIPFDSLKQNLISSQGALLQTQSDANPERILVSLPDAYKKAINLGDHFVTPIVGILGYDFGNYRLIETNLPQVEKSTNSNDSKLNPPSNDAIRIASYNVENLNRFEGERMKSIARQIVRSLGNPDILVLEEMQDDSGADDDGVTSAARNIQALNQLIQDNGGTSYSYIDPEPSNNSSGGISGGNIRTVLLYRTDRGIKLVNSDINWIHSNVGAFNNSRQPIICELSFKDQPFFILGVHLISNNTNSPLYGSVQPIQKPDEQKRISQAKWIVETIQKITGYAGEVPVFVVGDFNDVPGSKTLSTLENGGMVNLANKIIENERYSILYEGNAILFDQVLETANSIASVQGVDILHLNSGSSEKNQVSDHDPILVEVQFK